MLSYGFCANSPGSVAPIFGSIKQRYVPFGSAARIGISLNTVPLSWRAFCNSNTELDGAENYQSYSGKAVIIRFGRAREIIKPQSHVVVFI